MAVSASIFLLLLVVVLVLQLSPQAILCYVASYILPWSHDSHSFCGSCLEVGTAGFAIDLVSGKFAL